MQRSLDKAETGFSRGLYLEGYGGFARIGGMQERRLTCDAQGLIATWAALTVRRLGKFLIKGEGIPDKTLNSKPPFGVRIQGFRAPKILGGRPITMGHYPN